MNLAKKYAVYYRSMPAILDTFIKQDGRISVSKDGVRRTNEHSCPRMTLLVEPTTTEWLDKERLKQLEQLLDQLCSNNQLVAWS